MKMISDGSEPFLPKSIRRMCQRLMGRGNSIVTAISGGFDPITIGHIRYIKAAAKLGDELIVILNSDHFLMKKKGYVFMPQEERKEVISAIKGVTSVVECIDLDSTVCKTLAVLRPNIFAKGGDRTSDNIPEIEVCNENHIKMIFGVGGSDKPQSSSWLVENIIEKCKKDSNFRRRHGIR